MLYLGACLFITLTTGHERIDFVVKCFYWSGLISQFTNIQTLLELERAKQFRASSLPLKQKSSPSLRGAALGPSGWWRHYGLRSLDYFSGTSYSIRVWLGSGKSSWALAIIRPKQHILRAQKWARAHGPTGPTKSWYFCSTEVRKIKKTLVGVMEGGVHSGPKLSP